MPQEPEVDWKNVVNLIQRGDPAGEETLYQTLLRGARRFLQRRLGTQDVDDRVHDVFLIVVGTIRRGELQHPERLMAFVRTVLYRQGVRIGGSLLIAALAGVWFAERAFNLKLLPF